ncbi:MAG: tyrosine-type recombinase/integrase [Candidatus Acidiferrales bacterium]
MSLANVLTFPEPKKKLIRLRGERVSFSPPQLKTFLKAAAQHSERAYAMFTFALSHGARASEIADLRLSDLRFESCQVQIRRLKGSNGTLQPFVKVDGFDERAALEAWLRVRPEVDSDYVFISRQSNGANPYAMHRSQVYRLFRNICLIAGLTELGKSGSHILKHTCGQLLYDAGVDLSSIQQRLGHVSLSSTSCYAKPTQAQAHERMTGMVSKIFATE